MRKILAVTFLAGRATTAHAGLPRAVIDRPITLPAGIVELGVDVGGTRDPADDASHAGVALGLSDALELGVSCDAPLAHPDALGAGTVAAGYRVIGGPLEVAVRARHAPGAWTAGVELELRLGRVKLVSSGDQLGARLEAPIAIGVQVTPTVYAQLGARVPLDAAPSSTPVALDVVVGALPSADVVAELAIDGAAPDPDALARSLSWSLGLRYRPR